jgi:hypothetical protein
MWTYQHLVDADDVNLSDENVNTCREMQNLFDGGEEVELEVNTGN